MGYECDPTLLSHVRRYGRFDATGCFNCGSCTLSCELANDHASFPRRSTRLVLMGLRDLLHGSLEPWICHDCGDCSAACPRQTEPGAAMMTLRRYLASVYDWTGIASRINQSAAWHFLALFLVALTVLLLIVFYHLWEVGLSFSDFKIPNPLDHMFPTIIYFTRAAVLGPLLILLTNAFRMYLLAVHRIKGYPSSPSHALLEARAFLLHFFTYRKMSDCPTAKERWAPHLMLGMGCMIMLFIKVFALRWFQTGTVHPIYHPQRWIGYVAAAFMIYGAVNIIFSRTKKTSEAHKSSEFCDWSLPLLLLATAVSGIAIHICRVAGLELAAHYTYAAHLMIAVPMLVVELPFGKLTHMVYRPLALYLLSLREKAVLDQWSAEEIGSHAAQST